MRPDADEEGILVMWQNHCMHPQKVVAKPPPAGKVRRPAVTSLPGQRGVDHLHVVGAMALRCPRHCSANNRVHTPGGRPVVPARDPPVTHDKKCNAGQIPGHQGLDHRASRLATVQTTEGQQHPPRASMGEEGSGKPLPPVPLRACDDRLIFGRQD